MIFPDWSRRRFTLLMKRMVDLTLGSIALLVLSPLLALTYVIVGVSMGKPVLFRQSRLGFEGSTFQLLKFRTMTEEKGPDGDYLPDDQRITKVGRLLRSTTLDELPELVNVVKGDLSLVGPRPLLPRYRERYSTRQWRRHEMPPGMAGPVMAKGRNNLPWEEKFEWDVWYVENWSLLLDAKVFASSVVRLLTREGVSPAEGVTMKEFEGGDRISDVGSNSAAQLEERSDV